MYSFLCRYLPPWAAEVALVVWYLLLITAVILALEFPQTEFRYGDL